MKVVVSCALQRTSVTWQQLPGTQVNWLVLDVGLQGKLCILLLCLHVSVGT